MSQGKISRRQVLRQAIAGSLGFGILGNHGGVEKEETALDSLIKGASTKDRSMIGVPFERHETVRLAVVGTGLRGRETLREFLSVPGVQVTALCDVVQDKVLQAKAMVEQGLG